jgi:hypothetical protein
LRRPKKIKEKLARNNRQSFMLNHREMNALNAFCKKYKISNRSKFMREAVMTAILKKFDEDYPSLFEQEEQNLFNRTGQN